MHLAYKLSKEFKVTPKSILEVEKKFFTSLKEYLKTKAVGIKVDSKSTYLRKHLSKNDFGKNDLSFLGQFHIYNEPEKFGLEVYDQLSIIFDDDPRYQTLPTKKPELLLMRDIKKVLEGRLLNDKKVNKFHISVSIFRKVDKANKTEDLSNLKLAVKNNFFLLDIDIFTSGVWQK